MGPDRAFTCTPHVLQQSGLPFSDTTTTVVPTVVGAGQARQTYSLWIVRNWQPQSETTHVHCTCTMCIHCHE